MSSVAWEGPPEYDQEPQLQSRQAALQRILKVLPSVTEARLDTIPDNTETISVSDREIAQVPAPVRVTEKADVTVPEKATFPNYYFFFEDKRMRGDGGLLQPNDGDRTREVIRSLGRTAEAYRGVSMSSVNTEGSLLKASINGDVTVGGKKYKKRSIIGLDEVLLGLSKTLEEENDPSHQILAQVKRGYSDLGTGSLTSISRQVLQGLHRKRIEILYTERIAAIRELVAGQQKNRV